ncbi:hypothetical protein JCM9279_005715 [Rhodotorula babjevae]
MPSRPQSARPTPPLHRSPSLPSPPLAPGKLDNTTRKLRWDDEQAPEEALRGDGQAAAAAQEQAQVEEDERDAVEGGVLAITAAKGRVGCCFYDPVTDKLSFLEDQHDSAGWDLTSLLIEQLLPDTVIASSSADAGFLDVLDAQLAALPATSTSSAASTSGVTGEANTRLEYRPAREFYAGQGKYALSQLHIQEGGWYASGEQEREDFDSGYDSGHGVDGDLDSGLKDAYDFGGRPSKRRKTVEAADPDGDASRRNHELRVEAFLNSLCTSSLTVGCAGALLNRLHKQRSDLGELNDGIQVKGLELIKLDKIMLVNSDALTSLQIFQDEAHAATGSSATKEGLSLFAHLPPFVARIVNIARTPLGKILMRRWFIRPSLELDIIEARHDAVECFVRDENQPAVDAIESNFKHIKNVRRVLKAIAGGDGSLSDWQATWMFVFGSIQIRDAVLSLEHRKSVEVVDKLLDSFDSLAFKDLGEIINNVIDWQESQLTQGKVCVRPGIDAELDKLRRRFAGLESFLSSVAKDVAYDLPRELAKDLSLVYFPQLGYLITIAYEPDVTDADKYGAFGWDFQFVTEQQAYFKSAKCRDLDRHIGDLQCFISDKEIEILHALVGHVLELQEQMLAAADVLAELDCLTAFAGASRLYDWARPVMTEDAVCKIIKGRHPLAELCVDTFVPNHTSLVGGQAAVKEDPERDVELRNRDDKSMIILTGANFSGKSVYLKQVALITFMAHIGCFVPAEDALVGLTDRIMTRVSTRESITRGSSAFMIDLQQIAFALRNLTPRSLLVLDEFGKGTEADDGAGLFCGVIEHLLGLGRDAPRVVVATHFQHVFMNGLLSRKLPATLAHMEILVDESSAGSSDESKSVESVAYLYRLAPGLALSSHATSLASLFGLSPEVLRRAEDVSHAVSTFSLDALALSDEAQMSMAERDELREAEACARRFIGLELGAEGEGGEQDGVEELKERLRWVVERDGGGFEGEGA